MSEMRSEVTVMVGPLILSDMRAAFRADVTDFGPALPEWANKVTDPPTFDDVDDILFWFWRGNEQRGGTEVDVRAVFTHLWRDGVWYLAAWNDYTGWGCQDGATLRWAPTLGDLVRFGLEAEDRERWNLPIEGGADS